MNYNKDEDSKIINAYFLHDLKAPLKSEYNLRIYLQQVNASSSELLNEAGNTCKKEKSIILCPVSGQYLVNAIMLSIQPLWEVPQFFPNCAQWAYNEWYQKRGIDRGIIFNDYSNRSQREHDPFTFIAHAKGVPCGMITLKKHVLQEKNNYSPWLVSLFIDASFRGQGIGTLLVKHLCKFAASSGYEKVYLFLSQKNKEKLKYFYTKRGWEYLSNALDNDGVMTKIFIYPLNNS